MYRWWVYIHLLGVVGIAVTHGVSVFALFRIRAERDPQRVLHLIELSGASMPAFYASFLFLLIGGIGAGFNGNWWSSGWLWLAIVLLLITFGLMSAIAKPYFARIGVVARSRADGSEAVSEEEFQSVRRAPQGWTTSAIGFGGFVLILTLMFWKPSIPLIDSGSDGPTAPAATAAPADGPVVDVAAEVNTFTPGSVSAPAGTAFSISFDNRDSGVPHNVAIHDEQGASVFTGEVFNGVATRVYAVPSLKAGAYQMICDVHPDMTATLTVG